MNPLIATSYEQKTPVSGRWKGEFVPTWLDILHLFWGWQSQSHGCFPARWSWPFRKAGRLKQVELLTSGMEKKWKPCKFRTGGRKLEQYSKSRRFFLGGWWVFFPRKIYLKIAINIDLWVGCFISGCFSRSGDSMASARKPWSSRLPECSILGWVNWNQVSWFIGFFLLNNGTSDFPLERKRKDCLKLLYIPSRKHVTNKKPAWKLYHTFGEFLFFLPPSVDQCFPLKESSLQKEESHFFRVPSPFNSRWKDKTCWWIEFSHGIPPRESPFF